MVSDCEFIKHEGFVPTNTRLGVFESFFDA
jgi:hypothetical protein